MTALKIKIGTAAVKQNLAILLKCGIIFVDVNIIVIMAF